MNLWNFSACYLASCSFSSCYIYFCGPINLQLSTLWSVSSSLSDRSYKCMGTNSGKTCGVGELHLARGSLMKGETALSWGFWHVDSCAASMALRWLYCISLQDFSFTVKLHKRQSRKCRFVEKGKRNFFSHTGPFCPHLPPTPVMQFWQSHAGNCCKGLQPLSSLFLRQTGAVALHISWKCLWTCNISPRHALSAHPCIVLWHRACPVFSFP